MDWVVGYIKHTVNYKLINRFSSQEKWSDLKLIVYSDASFSSPKSQSGYLILLEGAAGSLLPLEWASKKQTAATTSSAESEVVASSLAVKAALRIAGCVDELRNQEVEIELRLDNSAICAAIAHGQSLLMSHLKRHIGVSFSLLQQVKMKIRFVKSSENLADLFTKPLNAATLKRLCSQFMKVD